jgi:hypothetical protein
MTSRVVVVKDSVAHLPAVSAGLRRPARVPYKGSFR